MSKRTKPYLFGPMANLYEKCVIPLAQQWDENKEFTLYPDFNKFKYVGNAKNNI